MVTDMQQETWLNRSRWGLGTTLLLWFLVLALTPMAVVSIISYRTAYTSLHDSAASALTSAAALRTKRIRSYFREILTDLRLQAEMQANTQFLGELIGAFEGSGTGLSEFVRSFRYAKIVDESGADLRTFRRTYGYHDVFLIDPRGNVLFTVAGEADLGTNLFKGRYSGTLLAAACRRALETGRAVFSDYEFYEPSGHTIAGFLASVLLDDDGGTTGVVAIRVPIDRIDAIMQERTGLGETGESYLVGPDMRMRSNSVLAEEQTILGDVVRTEQTRTWLKEHGGTERPLACKHSALSQYVGRRGVTVLGTHSTIEVGGIRVGLIAEIEAREAFAPAVGLGHIVIVLLITTAVLVLLTAVPLAKRIVRPILTLSVGAGRVADGDLEARIEVTSRNEIGELAGNFNTMVGNLRRTMRENEARRWSDNGRAELGEHMRGGKDISTLCGDIISFLAKHLNAQVGTICLVDGERGTETVDEGSEEGGLKRAGAGAPAFLSLAGSYAYTERVSVPTEFKFGEGLIGQAAQEARPILVTDVPEDYITVTSALGETIPRAILCFPFLYEGQVAGVIELGSLEEFTDQQLGFLNQVGEGIAIAVHATRTREQTKALLEESQAQAEELQSQEEELRTQEEELRTSNEELQAAVAEMEEQRDAMDAAGQAAQEYSGSIVKLRAQNSVGFRNLLAAWS